MAQSMMQAQPSTKSMTNPAQQVRRSNSSEGLHPVRGILSLHGRKQSKTWSCLVCKSVQTNDVCSACNRDRVPQWLVDVNGRTIQPGLIVRCSRDLARYVPPPAPVERGDVPTSNRSRKSKSPSCLARSTLKRRENSSENPPVSPPLTAVCRFRATPQRPGRAAKQGCSPKSNQFRSKYNSALKSASLSKNVAGGSASVLTQPSQRARGTCSDRPGVAEGRADVEFEGFTQRIQKKFEAEPGDCAVMVVTINGFLPRRPLESCTLEGYCIVPMKNGDDRAPDDEVLAKVVIDMQKVGTLTVVDQALEKERYNKFLNFGLCGRCDRTYRIFEGWRHTEPQSARTEREDELARLKEVAIRVKGQKFAFRCARDFQSSKKASETLRAVEDNIARAKRSLEPLVMSCPFCLWDGTKSFETSSR